MYSNFNHTLNKAKSLVWRTEITFTLVLASNLRVMSRFAINCPRMSQVLPSDMWDRDSWWQTWTWVFEVVRYWYLKSTDTLWWQEWPVQWQWVLVNQSTNVLDALVVHTDHEISDHESNCQQIYNMLAALLVVYMYQNMRSTRIKMHRDSVKVWCCREAKQ